MLAYQQSSALFESEKERKIYQETAELDRIVVPHPGLTAAVNGINNCIKASIAARSPECCMLLGEGGMGKTTIAKLIMKSMPPQTVVKNDCEIDTAPSFYMSLPSNGKLSEVTEGMLRRLNDLDPMAGSNESKTNRVVTLLKRCDTVIVFIDETHNLSLIQKRDALAGQKINAWLKGLFNVEAPVICLLGTLECRTIFDHSPEMSRRYKSKFLLLPLDPGTPDAPGSLQGFLGTLSKKIVERTSVTKMPSFANYGMALSVWAATRGNVDFTATLLKIAARFCLLAGRDVVTEIDLAAAWDTGMFAAQAVTRGNPFRMQMKDIAKAIRG